MVKYQQFHIVYPSTSNDCFSPYMFTFYYVAQPYPSCFPRKKLYHHEFLLTDIVKQESFPLLQSSVMIHQMIQLRSL